jgi:nucleoside-diphosphate kinase
MAVERTLVLIKPDGVRRALIGEIIGRFERKGLRVIGVKMLRFDDDLARRHYDQHVNRDFFPPLLAFIKSGPAVALVLEGPDAIALTRGLMGATRHTEAAPGTIRGDLASDTRENLVHGSDSPERAAVEVALFFQDSELF